MKEEFKTDERRKLKRLGCLFVVFSAIMFIILTLLAMFTYYPVFYSFFTDYFSNLGITVFSFLTIRLRVGTDVISPTLWNFSIVLLSIAFGIFWYILQTIFIGTKKMKSVSRAGMITGLVSSAFFIGVAIFPVDFYGFAHIVAGYGFFILLGITIILFSIAIFLNEETHQDYWNFHFFHFKKRLRIRYNDKIFWGRFRVVCGITVSILAFCYVFTPAFQPIFQKIAVYSVIFWMLIQSIWAWHVIGPGPDALNPYTLLKKIMEPIITKEMEKHLQGKITLEQAVSEIIRQEKKVMMVIKSADENYHRLKNNRNLQNMLSFVRLVTQNKP